MLENMCLTPFGGTPTLFVGGLTTTTNRANSGNERSRAQQLKGGRPSLPDKGWTSRQLKMGWWQGEAPRVGLWLGKR